MLNKIFYFIDLIHLKPKKMFNYFLLFLDWLVIAASIYLLSLMSHALLWGFAVGMMVIIGLFALGQAFRPSSKLG